MKYLAIVSPPSIYHFPCIFLDGVSYPTIIFRKNDVTLANAVKNVLTYDVKYNDKFIYPFAEHEIFASWIHDMIEHRTILPQFKSCMQKNPHIRHSSLQ